MKYPYIGEYRNTELTVLFTGNGIGCKIGSNEYHSDWSELKYKNITREYLSNTWGIVESKEHAEFIVELAEVNGFNVVKPKKESLGWFSFWDNKLGFFEYEISASQCGCKQITIPLPPKECLMKFEEKPKSRNKSKQAYEILKSLDYDYDLVKQKWFKKEYI